MSSFQLVNHQLKHLFGGIQAETNSSIDYLENDQKKIAKSMQKAKSNHLKIYEAVSIIKNSLSDLNENCFSLFKEAKQSGSILWRLSNQINHVFQDISEQSLSLSKKMANKIEYYLPGLKKTKEKYTEYAQNLQHYRQKLVLLKKTIQKQASSTLAEDKERYERNIQKFRKAEKQYDEILIKTTTKFVSFNNEGMKDISCDLVSIFSTFASNIIQSGYRMTCFLQQLPQLSKSQQIKIKNKTISIGEKMNSLSNQHEQKETKRNFIQNLIIQKQISNYLKQLIDRDLAKIENKKIVEQFFKIEANNKKKQGEQVKQLFNSFQNQYNNSNLEHHKNHLLEKMKEQDPLQVCVDLLDIANKAQPFKKVKEIQNKSKQKLEPSKYLQISPEEEKIKKNLDKFNKTCQQNPIIKQKNIQKQKNNQAKINLRNQDLKSPTTLKTKEQFFSLSYFDQSEIKKQNQKDPQQQLNKLHEHPFDFKIFQKPVQNTLRNPPSLSQKPPHPKVGDNPNPQPVIHPVINFDNFDIMMKDHQNEKKHDRNLSIPATSHISANFKQKKSSTTFEDFDLLNL